MNKRLTGVILVAGLAAGLWLWLLVGCASPTSPMEPVCRQYGFGWRGQDSSWVVPCENNNAHVAQGGM